MEVNDVIEKDLLPELKIQYKEFAAGLARGYLRNPVLTSEKFVDNPFRKGERMYKTGDLGKWLPDGNIEFIGRKDTQVKIRGHRIELQEIENVLKMHPVVKESVVLTRETQTNEKELVAFLLCETEPDIPAVKTYLTGLLPAYMIPLSYITLDKLPLTPHGKVDRNELALFRNGGTYAKVNYLAPRNETEEKLVKIWQEILDKQEIGVMDDFFESGGHSLRAVRMLSHIQMIFGVQLKLEIIFTNKRLEMIASEIDTLIWLKSPSDKSSKDEAVENLVF